MFFYTDKGSKTDFNAGALANLNPNTMYLKHLENLYYLRFIESKSDSFQERAQASREIVICHKKLKFWSHRITNQPLVDQKLKDLRAQWSL